MNVKILENDANIQYQISEWNEVDAKVLEASFFSKENDTYVKTFDKKYLMFKHNCKQIETAFKKYINIEVKGRRNINGLANALEWICDQHQNYDIKWWLSGSCALYVRGLNVIPHDIDIMTYKFEIDKIKQAIGDYIVEPFHHITGWVVKGFGVVDYNYRIDYAFEPEDWVDSQGAVDFGPIAENTLEEINWHGRKIRIPNIKMHILSNKVRNRYEIVQMIEKYIREKEIK